MIFRISIWLEKVFYTFLTIKNEFTYLKLPFHNSILAIAIAKAVGLAAFLTVTILIPIMLPLVVGLNYYFECPAGTKILPPFLKRLIDNNFYLAEKYITRFLILGGVLGILELSILKRRVNEATEGYRYSYVMEVVSFITFIMGSYFVYHAYSISSLNFVDSSHPNYCNYFVYSVAFWMTNVLYLFLIVFILATVWAMLKIFCFSK